VCNAFVAHFVCLKMRTHNNDRVQEMPAVSTVKQKAQKVGTLKKLSGKGILTAGTWRDRFCLLVKSKLYFYESEVRFLSPDYYYLYSNAGGKTVYSWLDGNIINTAIFAYYIKRCTVRNLSVHLIECNMAK